MLQKKGKVVVSSAPGQAELVVSSASGQAGRPVTRLISKPEVLDRVGVTFPTLWAWMRAGTFPRSRDLGGRACWLESEIDAWIENRPVRRLKGDPGGAS